MVKFLIIRFSSIGDIILTTPVIRCLKSQVEGAEVHFLTKTSFSPVLQNNPYIDKIHTLKKTISETCDELREEEFDYIIDLHHNLRTYFVKNNLKIISFSFKKLNIEKWLMVTFKINRLPKTHIVDRYFETVKLFDVENDNKGLDYYIHPDDEINLQTLPVSFQNGYIGFVIGAKHYTKKMPADKIISLIKKLNSPIVLLGGKEDIAEAEVIIRETGTLCYNATGKFKLGQSASLVKQAKLIISHDTGLMHIAAAFKKKILSLWGNTIPEFGMYPYLPDTDSEIFEVKDLNCRPCSKIGFTKCPKVHFKCMRDLDENKLVEKVRKVL